MAYFRPQKINTLCKSQSHLELFLSEYTHFRNDMGYLNTIFTSSRKTKRHLDDQQ